MLGVLLEFLVALLCEAIVDILLLVLVEMGFESMRHAVRRRRAANPLLAGLGLAVGGAVIGLVSVWLVPRRLVRPWPYLAGASLVLAPLGTGAVMHAFGAWRRRRGTEPSLLASFWGGALFAFAAALTRWLWLAGG